MALRWGKTDDGGASCLLAKLKWMNGVGRRENGELLRLWQTRSRSSSAYTSKIPPLLSLLSSKKSKSEHPSIGRAVTIHFSDFSTLISTFSADCGAEPRGFSLEISFFTFSGDLNKIPSIFTVYT